VAETPDKSNDEAILELARERFDLCVDAELEIRQAALDDKKFASGDQWPADIAQMRKLESRPCLTINRLPQTIRQITNDQKQNRPAIKVSPVDDNADVETAKIYQGITRHIEYSSDSDIAYDGAFTDSVVTGFGFFRVVTDYCDPYSFDQDIRIRPIKNQFSAYLDPHHQQPDGSDSDFGFVFEEMKTDDFRRKYPDSEVASLNDWTSVGDNRKEWVNEKSVRVCEYFYKEYETKTLVRLSDGNIVEKGHLPEKLPIDPKDGTQITVADERETQVPVIKWCLHNGIEILERKVWPGKWVPIIPVIGEEIIIDGRRILAGVVRYAKDPQLMYNVMASSEAEMIALSPKAPYIGAKGQFEGFERQWAESNRKTQAYLEYNETSLNGTPVGAPQRQTYEPAVNAISNSRMQASEDIKATTGVYDAALGNRSNENSGVAIQRRSMQSQTSNFHFMDNLSKSIRHTGRIIVDLIPHIYDSERAIRILGEDGSEEIVKINAEFDRKGQQVNYDMSKGTYDVTVNTGPSFETKRQEAVQAMLDFTKSMPQQAGLISDLLVKNMDWPQAQEISERLKRTLPPGVVDDPSKKQPLPPEAQAQIQQQSQLIDQLTKELHAHAQITEMKTIELESRERIEMAKIQANIEMKLADLGSKEGIALLGHEVASIKHRLDLLNINQPIQTDSENEPQPGQAPEEMAEQQQPSTGGQQSPGLPMEQQQP
jgi:hypothetical protein